MSWRGSARERPGKARRLAALSVAAALLTTGPAAAAPDSLFAEFREPFVLMHMYNGPDGKVRLSEATISARLTATGFTSLFEDSAVKVRIVHVPDGHYGDYHVSRPRHLTLLLQGDYILYYGDGEQYRLKPGRLLFAEDTTGRGHADRCEARTGEKVCVLLVMDPANPETSVAVTPAP